MDIGSDTLARESKDGNPENGQEAVITLLPPQPTH
jgi:hypothetical protein